MQNLRLASRYAKSLFDLAVEKGLVEAVYNDMLFLQELCTQSREFKGLLRSPVIKADKKKSIIDAVIGGKVNELTASFARLLVQKTRENEMPDIIVAFIKEYKDYKGIKVLKLTTAVPVSENVKQELIQKIKEKTSIKNIELLEKVDEGIIGGFVLQIDDLQIDASISYDLNKLRKQFLNNDFIYRIR